MITEATIFAYMATQIVLEIVSIFSLRSLEENQDANSKAYLFIAIGLASLAIIPISIFFWNIIKFLVRLCKEIILAEVEENNSKAYISAVPETLTFITIQVGFYMLTAFYLYYYTDILYSCTTAGFWEKGSMSENPEICISFSYARGWAKYGLDHYVMSKLKLINTVMILTISLNFFVTNYLAYRSRWIKYSLGWVKLFLLECEIGVCLLVWYNYFEMNKTLSEGRIKDEYGSCVPKEDFDNSIEREMIRESCVMAMEDSRRVDLGLLSFTAIFIGVMSKMIQLCILILERRINMKEEKRDERAGRIREHAESSIDEL